MLLGWLAWSTIGVGAEIFQLEHTRAPDKLTLKSYYMFDLYAPQDSPGPFDDSMPELALHDIQVHWRQKPDQWPYKGLEAAIIPVDTFWSLVHANSLCAKQRINLVLNGTSMKDAGVAVAPLHGSIKIQATVKRSGTWILVFTNCGKNNGAEVSGRISLRHSYGFLPAGEYWTMHMYGLLSVVYAMIAVLWFLAIHWQNIFHHKVHTGLLVVVVIAFLECFAAYLMHRWWNMSGNQHELLTAGILQFNSLKYIFALRLVLAVSSCQGPEVREEGSHCSVTFCFIASTFLVQQSMNKLLIQSRHRLSLNATYVLGTSAFGSLICVGIFAWVFAKYLFTDEWENRAVKDYPFVQVFISTRRLLLLTFGLATFVVMMQFVDITLDSLPWELRWIPHDGSPLLAFLIFTVLMMLIWWPNLDIWKLAYTQVGKEGHEVHDGLETSPEVAEKLEVEEDVLTDAPVKRSEQVVQPDIVGATSHHVSEDDVLNFLAVS